MKRTILFVMLTCIVVLSGNAQLLVESNGNVAVKPSADPLASYFSVNSSGNANATTLINSNVFGMDIGMWLLKRNSYETNNDYSMGINIDANTETLSTKKSFGYYTHVHKTSSIDSDRGRSYGVYAMAGNATSGWNYGVFGTINGENNGAGVFGSSLSQDGGINTGNRYAGFFHGNVKATNCFYGSSFITTSDYRLKSNIESIGTGCIDNVMNLNVVSYNLKQYIVDTGDTTTIPVNYYTDDPNLLEKTHYGLIAQELQSIYPDLVYEGADGYLSINYMEIIPLLIKSIQELKAELDVLTVNTNKTAPQKKQENSMATDILSSTILYQNDPNPFTENTVIKCFIPDRIANAVLYIYDLNGHQVDSKNITERGNVSLVIEGRSFDAGMYLYSLITNGTIVDTKRMILTK